MNSIIKFLLLFVTALFPLFVNAGSFQVTPVHLKLTPNQKTAVMSITANWDQTSTIQLEAVAWRQQNGKDVYEPTKNLLITPPIFKLKVGETRIVRIGLHNAVPKAKEVAYRLYIREVPPTPQPGTQGVQVALRIGIPVFVEPSTKISPKLHWHVRKLDKGNLQLEVKNSGNAHVQLNDLRFSENKGSKPKFIAGGALYLLPNQSRHWNIKSGVTAPLSQKKLQLFVTSGQKEQKIELPIEGM
ncbi:fimbrial biogenesis chaperone [Hydrogenovibrio kuenenii]|uniref:fimbrial biogenesis chaperone n=1 Tax=Hydrogenovibrio kuenenii TaxID=63658 RepID=UPI000466A6C8|nr:molecular chaperone [Hydrogenovibrio kuenenii]